MLTPLKAGPSAKGVKRKAGRPGSFPKIDPNYISWGVDPTFKSSWINHHKAWGSFVKKKEVVVAIIDTGIDFNHKHLKDNIYVREGIRGKSNFGKDFSVISTKSVASKKTGRGPSNTMPVDNHGHGTHVAGILKSVFPKVKILPIKYYNPARSGQENLKSLIRSFEYAIGAGVDIINYSGGGPEPAMRELQILERCPTQRYPHRSGRRE